MRKYRKFGAHSRIHGIVDNAEIKHFCDILHVRADKAVEKYGCGTAAYAPYPDEYEQARAWWRPRITNQKLLFNEITI